MVAWVGVSLPFPLIEVSKTHNGKSWVKNWRDECEALFHKKMKAIKIWEREKGLAFSHS